MIPNLTLFTPHDEARCNRFLYLGFLIPILFLVNILTFQPKLNNIMLYFKTYAKVCEGTGDYEEIYRVERIQRKLFISKIFLCIAITGLITWLVFYEHQATLRGFDKTFWAQISLLDGKIPNPYQQSDWKEKKMKGDDDP